MPVAVCHVPSTGLPSCMSGLRGALKGGARKQGAGQTPGFAPGHQQLGGRGARARGERAVPARQALVGALSRRKRQAVVAAVAAAAKDGTPPGFQGVELTVEEFAVGDRTVRLVLPADVDAVIDFYVAQGRLDRDPYWARPWPSAVALAAEVLARPELVRGRRVCDVGAGLGLEALAAALAGAAEVVLYDREELALHCALLSARANGLVVRPGELVLPDLGHPAAEEVGGGGGEGALVRAELLDWADPSVSESFDLVLACDVLYEKFSVRPVADLVPRLMAEGARLVLADPPNRTASNRKDFVEILQGEKAMALEETPMRRSELDGEEHDVQLMMFRRDTFGVRNTIAVQRL